MITTILSGLALLVVIADLILTVREKKRGEERNAAFEAWKDSARDTILHYIDSEIECVSTLHDIDVKKVRGEVQEIRDNLKKMNCSFTEYISRENDRKVLDSEQRAELEKEISTIRKRVHDLEGGIVPDYNEALAAKNSVDEFNKGLSAIMGYDPIAAYRKQAEKDKYGGEVE